VAIDNQKESFADYLKLSHSERDRCIWGSVDVRDCVERAGFIMRKGANF
jgi:hypothetical protein